MKNVNFGFNNSHNPNGSFEGIGSENDAKGIIKADFIGTMNIQGIDYLVTQATLCFNNDLVGKIDVRKAIVDVYKDGSTVLYIDQDHSLDCLKLEEFLNQTKVKERILEGMSLREVCQAYQTNLAFELATRSEDILATAIKHEVFERFKGLINRCHGSIISMQENIEQSNVKETSDYGRN